MNKTILLLMTIILLSVGLAAAAIPDNPHWFYGPVTIQSNDAVAGSVVVASIGGEVRGNFTVVNNGQYGDTEKLAVTHYSTDTSDIITFTITGSGCSVSNSITATFSAGKIENKPLSFTGSCASGSAAAPSGGGSAGGGGGAGVPKKITDTLVTDPSVISDVKQALPSGWSNVEVYEYGLPTSKSMDTTSGSIDKALTYASKTEAVSALQKLKASIRSGELTAIPVTATLTTYHIKNQDTGDWAFATGILLTATATEDTENVEIIEIIPSSVASLDQIVFLGKQPEILQSEKGIVAKWVISSMKKDENVQIKYFIKKKVTTIDTITLAAGKVTAKAPTPPTGEVITPPPPSAPKKPATPWVGIIIIVLTVAIGLVVYYTAARKKK